MSTNKFALVKNQGTISLADIPVIPFGEFFQVAHGLLSENNHHCVNYYAYPTSGLLKFICCIADDTEHIVKILAHEMPEEGKKPLLSLAKEHYPMHIYEREIAENYGIEFMYHPWAKPVRYAWNRADQSKIINDYPFYKIDGNELHEVGVGPIHAGVIEPGHFRFLCNGETVLHLEIQHGWQHRGVESLFIDKSNLLQRTVLSESIAGDTAVGHSLAFVSLMESMGKVEVSERLELERTIALELERIAMHMGDLGALSVDVAYQLGSSVFGTLRTPLINYTQTWCGNRFGKGLNRVGGTHYPFDETLADQLKTLVAKVERSYIPMADRLFSLPSFLMRAETIGKVTEKQMRLIGAVGMAARVAGMPRDIRKSHPFSAYKKFTIHSQTLEQGDVWARTMIRNLEVRDSLQFIVDLSRKINYGGPPQKPIKEQDLKLAPNSFCLSMVEGWRGEICHSAITGADGAIIHYKVKDPSLHNWLALALSLRDLEISDFPVNNKSYNLSYCGTDL